MVSFICSIWGEKYSIDYINKLYSMVKEIVQSHLIFIAKQIKQDLGKKLILYLFYQNY